MKNPWIVIGVISVVLFGGAIWYSSIAAEKNNEGVEIIQHIKGNPDAAITLVEYSDFQCPACGAFQPVAKEIMETYADDIRFEYKHFPLVRAHPFAIPAALAAEAAGQQGKFYEFHDKLFENQQTWSSAAVSAPFFIQYAEELDLDIPTFKRHMKSSLLDEKVRADFAAGQAIGVSATPSFFLNGEFMDPDEFQSYQGFIERIAAAVNPNATTSSASSSPSNTQSTGSGVRFGL